MKIHKMNENNKNIYKSYQSHCSTHLSIFSMHLANGRSCASERLAAKCLKGSIWI